MPQRFFKVTCPKKRIHDVRYVGKITSGVVTAAAQGAQFFLNLAYIMALARLLVPQEFGLVAMVTTVTGFLRIFQDVGLSMATVRYRALPEIRQQMIG
jgi:O-antigen/teichoic acid export membrane protein